MASFLKGEIRYVDIARLVEKTLEFRPKTDCLSLESVLETVDETTRIFTREKEKVRG